MSAAGPAGMASLPDPWAADPYLHEHHGASTVVCAWVTPTAVVVVVDAEGTGRGLVGLGAPEEVAAVLGDVARGRATSTSGERDGLPVIRSTSWATTVPNAFELLDDDEVTALAFSTNTSSADVSLIGSDGLPRRYPLVSRRRL